MKNIYYVIKSKKHNNFTLKNIKIVDVVYKKISKILRKKECGYNYLCIFYTDFEL
ncbi:hypothetical protein J5751_02595 [bacterium]|nr:hypothetical protein [bacterium]